MSTLRRTLSLLILFPVLLPIASAHAQADPCAETIAKGGLMYETTIGGQQFSYQAKW